MTLGDFDNLVRDEIPDPVDRFRLWLRLHASPTGRRVLTERTHEKCLPDHLTFEALDGILCR